MGLTMPLTRDAVLLRIFIGEDDKAGRQPLYEAIVLKAREMGLAGATVLRGPMGFGHSSRLHTTKVLRLSQDLPLVIEIVENEDTINRFGPQVAEPSTAVAGSPSSTATTVWPGSACIQSARASSSAIGSG